MALAGDEAATRVLGEMLADSGPIGKLYMEGDTVAAWDALLALGSAVREPAHLSEAWGVAWETMRRVRYNLEILIQRLAAIGYQGACLGAPCPVQDIDEVERRVGGPAPLSIRAFWEVVGTVDFCQAPEQIMHDWLDVPTSDMECLGDDDPLMIRSPSVLLKHPNREIEPWPTGHQCFEFGDERHWKSRVSGGAFGQCIWLPDASADFRICGDMCPPDERGDDELDGQYFVRMLRQTMLGGGFRGPIDRDQDQIVWLPLRALELQLASGLLPI